MEHVKLKATLMWAHLNKVNPMSNKYQVDLCDLSDAAVKALEAFGLEVKNKEGKGHFVTAKSTRPIFAYDDGGSPIDGDIVGNGSKAAVMVTKYPYNYRGNKGWGASVAKMVVTDLKEYHPGSGNSISLEEDELL